MSGSRKALQAALKQAYEEIPPSVTCARCGIPLLKEAGEFHHPAGRRKAAYCFGVILHKFCHDWTHQNPKDAEAIGLLLAGRNSKVLTIDSARALVNLQPFPALYSLSILEKYQS